MDRPAPAPVAVAGLDEKYPSSSTPPISRPRSRHSLIGLFFSARAAAFLVSLTWTSGAFLHAFVDPPRDPPARPGVAEDPTGGPRMLDRNSRALEYDDASPFARVPHGDPNDASASSSWSR